MGRGRRRGTRGAQPPQLPLLCSYPLCSFIQSLMLVRTPPRSFVPSCARSYSPHSPRARLYRPRCSVHTPCARSNPPPSPRARSFLLVLVCTVPGCCEYTDIFPFFSLLSIVSITFLIYFRSIYLKHTS